MEARQIIAKVMQEVQGLAKRDKNTAQGFNFRGIDAVMNAVGPALRKHGGFIVPQVVEFRNAVGQTSKGSSINIVHVTVDYSVFGTEGEPIVGRVAAEAFDSGDKATAKAMSVAYRTFLLQLLCLPTDEPDPDTYSYEIGQSVVYADFLLQAESAFTKKDLAKLKAVYAEAQQAKLTKEQLEQIVKWGKELGNS